METRSTIRLIDIPPFERSCLQSVLRPCRSHLHYLGLAPKRTLCVLPLAFDYGQNQLLSTWAAGGCAIAFDYLLPRDVVRAVGRHDVTVLAGVPPLWHQLAEADWSGGEGESLRTLTNSGGHLACRWCAAFASCSRRRGCT